MIKIKIQKCKMSDLKAVTEFYDKVTLHLTKTINYPKWSYGEYPSIDSVKKAISDGVQFMCFENNVILGAFILNDNPEGAYEKGNWQLNLNKGEYLVIHTLATDPDFHNRGTGKFMVNYCISYAKEHGFKAVRLDVVPDNIPAKRLYEKLGFTFAGEKDLERDIEEIPTFDLYELNF